MIFAGLAKKKDYKANIFPEGQEIIINKGETLLSGALRSGLAWPHKCQVGSCGTCRCKIIEGSIRPEIDFNYVLDQQMLHRVSYWHVSQHLRQILRSQ